MIKIFKNDNFAIQIIETIVGAAIMAIGTALLLLPNKLSSGGFSGIATILYYLGNVPMGITILVLNTPLFLVAAFRLGKKFFIKSLIGTISISVFIDIFDKLPALTNDRFLACICGGIFSGIGTAIILYAQSSTGGSDLLSNIIKSFNRKLKTGNLIVTIDAIIVLANVIVFRNIEVGLYSGITIFILGNMIDIIFEGVNFTKLLFIVSYKNEEISLAIGQEVERGTTGIYGKGMYSGIDKLVLMCAANRNDVVKIKEITREIDPEAFIIVANSREVLGEGFKRD